jgi:hypothetical protein
MFPLPSDDILPEQDKLPTEIINGRTVIRQNPCGRAVWRKPRVYSSRGPWPETSQTPAEEYVHPTKGRKEP